jgi:hypothetical protein
MTRSAPRHAAALTLFMAATALWLWPFLGSGEGAIPGAGPGDNLTFVWNLWWTRFALHHAGAGVFFSSFLFFPFGADLTLHTHTLGPALLTSGVSDPIVAQNALNALHLFLNFSLAYALAWRETRQWIASVLGAVVFACSPYVAAHLQGHFNLIAAWALPLAALAALRVRDRPTIARGAALGLALGAIAYVDYYLVVFASVLAVCLLLPSWLRLESLPGSPRWLRRCAWLVIALLAVDAVLIAWIVITGGGALRILGAAVSVRGVSNPVAAGWLVLLLWLAATAAVRLRVRPDAGAVRRASLPMIAAAAVFLAAVLPLAFHAAALWRSGAYVTQRYLWRSAPPGIDLSTLVLGNPYSAVYGAAATRVYRALHVDLIEQVGWITPAALIVSILGLVRSRGRRSCWLVPLALFGVWALGPFIAAAGHGTPLWLPATLVRWVPIVNNARIPGRAIVVVYLCLAVFTAIGFSTLIASGRRGLAAVLAVLLLVDCLPQRPPSYRVSRPGLYATLHALPPGAVCELPFGIRDGFGETGTFDARSMFFQTIHEHELVGGFLGRMPPAMPAQYRALPVVGAFLRLSAGEPLLESDRLVSPDAARVELRRLGIKYIVVNDTRCPSALVRYVRDLLPATPIAHDAERSLYDLGDGR